VEEAITFGYVEATFQSNVIMSHVVKLIVYVHGGVESIVYGRIEAITDGIIEAIVDGVIETNVDGVIETIVDGIVNGDVELVLLLGNLLRLILFGWF
jgi:hypothetical protein